MIAPLANLNGAESLEMIGDVLRVEQAIAAGAQPRHQMHQRNFRGVARAVEHALAEEGAAERDAIEPAGQLIAVIDFDGMAMAVLVEAAINLADAAVDPGAGAVGLLGSAQPSITASKSRSTDTVKGVVRTVRASRAGK